MPNMISSLRTMSRRSLFYLVAATLLASMLLNLFVLKSVSAAQITSRKLTLSTSSAASSSATTTYTFNFTVPSSTVLQSFEAVICTTASGSCSTPSGFSNSSSTLSSQPTNLGDATGWSVNTSTAGKLRIKKTGNAAAPTGSQTVVFGNVQNPTTANQTFFARLNTYSDDAWTTGVDSGVVAASTSNLISLSATVDETLTFCTGSSGITSSSCAGAANSTISLLTSGSNNVSPSATAYGTSQIGVGTNALSGYAITVSGTTLTCSTCSGTPTISALASQTASTTGTEQFGFNLKDNATPDVGVNPDGSGTANPSANYNTADQFRFVTGDTVASKSSPDQFRRFHASYIANIDTSTEAGTYTTTLTYVATATF